MTLLFIVKPLSPRGNGVVSAMQSQLLLLQKQETVAVYNLGVDLPADIADTVYKVANYETIDALPAPFNQPDLVIFEEVYKIEYLRLYRVCLKRKIPYVIIPHGCLVRTEQDKKPWKHWVANTLFFNRFIRKAVAVQYLNDHEVFASRDFRCRQTVIIPNSVDCQPRSYPRDTDVFKFIYIGRYDVHVKGLDLLIETFISLQDWCRANHVILELYGPKDPNLLMEAWMGRIEDDGCCDIIQVHDAVYGEEKLRKLQAASVFIQTSRNEGQPMGIMEALSYGLPCVVTYTTTFGHYCNDHQCGIGTPFILLEVAAAIRKIHRESAFFQQCCDNAARCAKRDFHVEAVTRLTIDTYRQLLQ